MFAGVIHIYGEGMGDPIRSIDLRDLWADLNGDAVGRIRFEAGVDVGAITTNGAIDLYSSGAGSAAGGRTNEDNWFSGSVAAVE